MIERNIRETPLIPLAGGGDTADGSIESSLQERTSPGGGIPRWHDEREQRGFLIEVNKRRV